MSHIGLNESSLRCLWWTFYVLSNDQTPLYIGGGQVEPIPPSSVCSIWHKDKMTCVQKPQKCCYGNLFFQYNRTVKLMPCDDTGNYLLGWFVAPPPGNSFNSLQFIGSDCFLQETCSLAIQSKNKNILKQIKYQKNIVMTSLNCKQIFHWNNKCVDNHE